ncbi:MAG: DUF4974 domain-containing protein [Muribaculaceae bacterium]|nr:DUF4974 domain-containing protein [Muribaculaceae bacterium]
METKDFDFVARFYKKGSFNKDVAWSRLGITTVSWWSRFRVAAAVAVLLVVSASAALIYHQYQLNVAKKQAVESVVLTPLTEVKVIDFENASLNEIVREIESVYNVKVENLPDTTRDYNLSLHYEGTPIDLIETINDILGTQMTVVER